METLIAGHKVLLDQDGYLKDHGHWNAEVGSEIAKNAGIEMSDRHWDVVTYLQDQHKSEEPLTIRRVGKSGVVNIKEFYSLFPDGPLKIATKIAGIPRPVSCI